MTKPTTPFQPYASVHASTSGPGDARPTALQIISDHSATNSLRGKTILITGCSSGIGVETARALYTTGAQLFLTARDLPKLQTVITSIISSTPAQTPPLPTPQPLLLDLSSLSSVRSAAAEFTQRSSSQLSILIMNAGVMAAPLDYTVDGFETHMGTNHFAHFLLFQLLKPLLLQSAASDANKNPSRVIFLSSAGHRWSGIREEDLDWRKAGREGYGKWVAYGQSKTANIYTASAANRRYAGRGVVVVSVHPGGIQTELGRYMTEEEIKAATAPGVQSKYKSVEQGAATTVWAAVAGYLKEGKENGGRYLADCGECGPMPENVPFASGYAPHVYDEGREEWLWKESCRAVGVEED